MAENEDSRSEEKVDSAKGYYEEYKNYANTLRLWFVAYGIGGPVLFVTQPEAWQKLAKANVQDCVIIPFLVGVFVQVFLACLNKYVNWINYFKGNNLVDEKLWRYRIAHWASKMIVIDISLDLATFFLFTWSTKIAFSALVG